MVRLKLKHCLGTADQQNFAQTNGFFLPKKNKKREKFYSFYRQNILDITLFMKLIAKNIDIILSADRYIKIRNGRTEGLKIESGIFGEFLV